MELVLAGRVEGCSETIYIPKTLEYGSVDGEPDGNAHGTRRRNGRPKLSSRTQPLTSHRDRLGHAKTYNHGHLEVSCHARNGQARTYNYGHPEMNHCPKAAVPWCFQGKTKCTESGPNSTETVIRDPVINEPMFATFGPGERPENPPPPQRKPPLRRRGHYM